MTTPMPQSPGPSPEPSRARGFNFNDFITFRFLITPAVITVVYVIGAILITVAALVAMAGGSNGVLSGILILLFGNLYWRVILEFVVVLFKMNDSLQSIDRRGRL